MALAAGDLVTGLRGAYRVDARHGEGSFGVTYRATDAAGAPVLLKELRVEKLDDWKALELFEREGEVLATLSHPNIPAFRDFFAHGASTPLAVSTMSTYDGPAHLSLVLVQELIEGATLQQHLDRAQPLSPGDAERVLRALLAALHYLHDRDPVLVHRDVKPGNIILTPDGRPYLVDFGAVQNRVRRADSVGSTIVGTLGYMPLEQIRGQAVPASDLYALGMTIVVALAGQSPETLPIDESSGKVAIDRVVPAETPTALRRALDAMIEVVAGQRVHSAEEALQRLDDPSRESRPAQGAEETRREPVARRRAVRGAAAREGVAEQIAREPTLEELRRADRSGSRKLPVILAGTVVLSAGAALVLGASLGGALTSPGGHGTVAAMTDAKRDTLFGKTLTAHFQAIDVHDAPHDVRFATWPPPAWVDRIAAAWKPGAQLAGMSVRNVDATGVVALEGNDGVEYDYVADGCYSGFSSGARTTGLLDIAVDAPTGAVRVRALEQPNTSGRPRGLGCSLTQAFAAMAAAGRLSGAPGYVVRNDDMAITSRWDFSAGSPERPLGSVDVASCAVVR